MESPATSVEEMNKRVVNLTEPDRLPVYQVEEVLAERRLCTGKHLIEQNGIRVEFERRKAD